MADYGYNVYDLDNPIISSDLKASSDPVRAVELRLLIKDDNDKWVDFSDRMESRGKNKLVDFGTFKHSTEKRGGLPILESATGSVILDNSDGFFDQEITDLVTVEDSAADFSQKKSKNSTETSWNDREVKFELYLTLIDDSIIIKTIGVYIIKDTHSSFSNTSTFSLELQTKMNLLKNVDASVVKSGINWYRNKHINFLIKELLKTRFADDSGELPSTYHIEDIVSIPVPDEVGKAYSVFGEPPQDSFGSNLEKSYIRCLDIWNYNTGTISSSNDRAFTITSSANWTTGSYLKPKAGDVITVKDSSNGNDGDYEISSISGTTVTLRTPLNGLTESDMSFNISRLYLVHKDTELWEFIPMTNIYNYIGRCDSAYYNDYSSYDNEGIGIPIKLFVRNDQVYIVEAQIPPWTSNIQKTFGKGYWMDYDTAEPTDRILNYDGSSITIMEDDSSADCLGGGAESSVFMVFRTPIGTDQILSSRRDTENLLITFNQANKIFWWNSVTGPTDARLLHTDEITSTSSSTPNIEPGNWAADTNYPNFVPKGYWVMGSESMDSPVAPMIFSWSEGDKICFADDWGTAGAIVFLQTISEVIDDSWDTVDLDHDLKIRVYDIATGVNTVYTLADSGYVPLGVTITYNKFSEDCILSVLWVAEPETSPSSYEMMISRVYSIDSVGNFQTLEYDNSEYLTVLDLVAVNATTYIMSLFYRNDKANPYKLVYATFGAGPSYNLSITTTFRKSVNPFIKLTSAGANLTDSSKDDVVCFHKYENRVFKYNANANTMVPEANGSEAVANDGTISSPLVVDIYSRHEDIIVYGISWTGEDPVMTAGLKLPSKGVLWKLDNYITPYIELADFNGLSVADAIGKLAQACNYLAFFNVEGDFYFVSKAAEESEDYIFEINDNESLSAGKIEKDNGYKEIYNHFTIVPYRTETSEINFEIILVKRDDNEESQDIRDTIEINSLNNLKRSVRLVCVKGGKLDDDVLFKWLITFTNIGARLREDVSETAREFQLVSVFGGDQLEEGIHTGDFISFAEPDDGASIAREIMGGKGVNNLTSTTSGSNEIEVTDSSIYSVGDIVHAVYSTGGVDYRYKYSILQIADTSLFLSANFSHTLSGTYDLLAPIKNSSGYITISSATGVFISAGSEVEILKASSEGSGELRTWSSDDLTYLTAAANGTTIYVNKITNIEVGTKIKTPTGDLYSVTAVDREYNEVTVDDTLVADLGTNLSLFWAPVLNTFIKIPDTGFELSVVNNDVIFKEGDVIVISTEGLVLKEDERSRKLAVSLDSKSKYGKRDFPTIKNRYINEKLAEILSRNLLSFYKHPRYHLNLEIYLMPLIDFIRINRLASFKIISKILFPRAKNYSRYFYLRTLENNIKSKSTSLELIDKDFY